MQEWTFVPIVTVDRLLPLTDRIGRHHGRSETRQPDSKPQPKCGRHQRNEPDIPSYRVMYAFANLRLLNGVHGVIPGLMRLSKTILARKPDIPFLPYCNLQFTQT